jgi:hypothetical protein
MFRNKRIAAIVVVIFSPLAAASGAAQGHQHGANEQFGSTWCQTKCS